MVKNKTGETLLTREDIIKGDYIYETDLIPIKATTHLYNRLFERGMRFDLLPTYIRVTKDNVYSGKTYDNKHIHSVVVRLHYSYKKWLFIVINPFDRAAKSMWFRTKNRKDYGYRNNCQQAVRDDRSQHQDRRCA